MANLNDEERLYQKGRGKNAGIDWASGAGALGIGMPLMLIPGAGTGVAARAGWGALQGGLDAAAQPTATGSLADRAKNAGVGTLVGGVAAPIAGAVGDKLVKALRSVPGRLSSAAANLTGNNSASRVLSEVPDIANLPQGARNDLIAEAQAQIGKTGKLDAAALGRKANLLANGLTPTTSMVTRAPAQWTMERNLQNLAQSHDEAVSNTGQELTRVCQGNDKGAHHEDGQACEALRGRHPGRARHGGDAKHRCPRGVLPEGCKAVYDHIKVTKGDQLASDARNVVSTLHDPDVADNAYAEPIINSVTKRLKRFGMIDDEGKLTQQTMTVTQAEEFRKSLQTLNSGDPKTDRIATMFTKATDSDVLSGTGENAFGAGRSAASARFDMLGNPATQKLPDSIGELVDCNG
jgi:hypothetical protein